MQKTRAVEFKLGKNEWVDLLMVDDFYVIECLLASVGIHLD